MARSRSTRILVIIPLNTPQLFYELSRLSYSPIVHCCYDQSMVKGGYLLSCGRHVYPWWAPSNEV
jgi:hypothetical protein